MARAALERFRQVRPLYYHYHHHHHYHYYRCGQWTDAIDRSIEHCRHRHQVRPSYIIIIIIIIVVVKGNGLTQAIERSIERQARPPGVYKPRYIATLFRDHHQVRPRPIYYYHYYYYHYYGQHLTDY